MARPRSEKTVLASIKAKIVFAVLEYEPNDVGKKSRLYEKLGNWCFEKCDHLDDLAAERRLSEANQ